MRSSLNTQEAAYMLDVPAKDVPRICRRYDVHPTGRVRVGRSTLTLWAFADVVEVAKRLSPHLVRAEAS